jgi:hypothetical protein
MVKNNCTQRAQSNTRSPCGLRVSFAPLRETIRETALLAHYFFAGRFSIAA